MAITYNDLTLAIIAALIDVSITLPVTYLVVDRIIERREKKSLEPIEQTAKERLRSKLGVGSLTTLLIGLLIDVRSSADEKRPMGKEVTQQYLDRLKTFQSDLEMLLGIYNNVLSIEVEHVAGSIISEIEHLQEDLQFLLELHPRHVSLTHVDHIEQVILRAVQLTKRQMDLVGGNSEQIRALETWLIEQKDRHPQPEPEEPVEVSGKHTLV